MELLTPNPGLVFWTTLSFAILLVTLRKYAWPSILRALQVREETISFALKDAQKAREGVEMMEQKRRKMIEETHKERDMILKEAKQLKDEIIAGAAEKAKEESRLLLEKANIQIEKQKQDALYEIKETIGQLSLEIAEKILREELSDVEKHKSIVNKYLNEVNFN